MKNQMTKQKGTIFLASCLLAAAFVGNPVPAEAKDAAIFSDIDGHWAKTAIERWVDAGVIHGNGSGSSFRPDDSLTRAELAVILDSLMGFQSSEAKAFSDVPQTAWYAEAIAKANAAGILLGDSEGNAKPLETVTREQAAVMLSRVFAVEGGTAEASRFTDANGISDWAASQVFGMEQAGYVAGMQDGSFSPKASVSRAQIVTMIDSAVLAYYNKEGTYTQDVGAAGSSQSGIVIVRTDGVVLKNMSVYGNLIIAEGVAEGNFTLDGAKLTGTMIVRGGGINSIHVINGAQVTGDVRIEKTNGAVRIVSNGVVIAELEADSEVILEGDFQNVTIGEGAEVTVKGTVKELTVEGKSSVTVAESAIVGTLTLSKEAEGATVTISGKVTTLDNNTESTKVSDLTATEEEASLGGGGGGGGGGGSGGTTDDTEDDPVTAETTAALGAEKATAAGLTEADYTAASWLALSTALAQAETTNTLAQAKTTAIQTALTGLCAKLTNIGTTQTIASGVYNLLLSKTDLQQLLPGLATTQTVTVTISGSAAGTYTAVYVDSLSAWLAYNIQGVSNAAISSGNVKR